MSDWTAGYVSEIEYTHGYYPELNPLRAAFALTVAGYSVPAIETACELGYGQGVSLNIHAAAGSARWWGTDFNPAHARFAQQLSAAAGGRAVADEQGFEEYCARGDLPMFDFIGLHGIWSWISPANRRAILALIRSRLKAGGVVYLSYNALPGWAAFAPMRQLLKQHADTLSAPGTPILRKMDEAIAFAERLLATQPAFAQANPSVKARFEHLRKMGRAYLVHEYLNDHWQALRFDECAAELDTAKLGFACSANLLDHVDALHLKPEQQKLIAEAGDPVFQQTLRDYCVNQTFRRDYWIKGAQRLRGPEHAAALRALRVVLVRPVQGFDYSVSGALGQAKLNEASYRPVLEQLADGQPRSLAMLEQQLTPKGGKGPTLAELVQVATVLAGKGVLLPAQQEAAIAAARPQTQALNAQLMERSRSNESIQSLASPVTGGSQAVSRMSQLFLLARQRGLKSEKDWAAFAWQQLAASHQRLLKDGKPLATPQENLAQLQAEAAQFTASELPLLQALGIA